MKFGQLIEYDMRNMFLETHALNVIVSCFIHFVFIVSQVEDYRNTMKLNCRPLAFTSYKAFFVEQNEAWN